MDFNVNLNFERILHSSNVIVLGTAFVQFKKKEDAEKCIEIALDESQVCVHALLHS